MATFDATKNFAKVTVSTGYDAAATSIVLASSHGARLPLPSTDGEFNLVWWNNTDYGDPTDDPNREIVRCTARSTDTLTIARAQEGEAAAIKNIAGKTYRMALTITKKVIDDIVDNLGASSTITVNQATHGFVVGDVVRSSGTDNQYTKAQANSEANAEVVGMVTLVEDASNFIITTSGLIDAAAAVPSATAGDVLFLSPTVAGGVTATAPATAGQVSKPLGIVTADDTEMIFINFRGALISDSDFPSQTYITVKMGTEADGDDNLTFSLTTGSFTAGKYLSVYKNGILQEEGASADYTISGTTIAVFNAVVLDTDKITLIVRSYEVTGLDDPMTTAGDIIYRNATLPTRLAIGTNGQFLGINSGNTAPQWSTAENVPKTVENFVGSDTLVDTESGKTCTNSGAGGAIELTLPSAAVGLNFSFVIYAAQYLRINFAAGDNGRYLTTTSATAGYFRNNEVGSFIQIQAIDATTWQVTSLDGTWSVDE